MGWGEGWPSHFDTMLDASFSHSHTQTYKHATDKKDPFNAMPIGTSGVQESEAKFT